MTVPKLIVTISNEKENSSSSSQNIDLTLSNILRAQLSSPLDDELNQNAFEPNDVMNINA